MLLILLPPGNPGAKKGGETGAKNKTGGFPSDALPGANRRSGEIGASLSCTVPILGLFISIHAYFHLNKNGCDLVDIAGCNQVKNIFVIPQ
jgi:hypothetical protein